MTDKSRTKLRPPLRTPDLSAQQRSLVELMREQQFGRVENVPIRAGQPIFNPEVRVVRVARLGGENGGINVPTAADFELKQSVCDLLDELARLQNGTILKLEFRHGLPCLLEIMASTIQGGCSE
jgi:hypothetical protein